MFRTIGLALAATAITFATPAATAIAGGDGGPPSSAFLSPAAAKAALGSWGLQDWKRARAVPSRLHFDDSCAPGLHPDRTVRVLRDRDDPHPATASIRSAIKQYERVSVAMRVKLDRRDRLHDCVNDLPGHDQLLNGMRVTSPSGTARVFGGALGSRGGARQLEYVVVARDGAAVEVCTFAAYAQDTLPEATLADLADRVLDRLAAAG
jgi:hypothetical protein